jgi:hypothetical protein
MSDSAVVRPDADLAHLLDLLDLLPPTTDGEFWKQFANDTGDHHMLEKLVQWAHNVHRPDPLEDAPRRLAEYCLLFFGTAEAPNDDRWNEVTPEFLGRADQGQRWVVDVAATAWRVYVKLEAERRRRERGTLASSYNAQGWPPAALRKPGDDD